ncbi:hypothetical protein WR25_02326 [Diploscapter pachys]|uniref:C2H2-type domain-containing protein n=1 Tax=Diploscapter pachys TaxID=2018661 RepID=A0A2A2LCN9_9BILA|nr:hypothetical protein WR25_02326 [Diploscapter pachys]
MQCPLCPTSKKTERSLEIHIAREHLDYLPWQCDFPDCTEKRFSGSQMAEHSVARHDEQSGMSYKPNSALKKELKRLLEAAKRDVISSKIESNAGDALLTTSTAAANRPGPQEVVKRETNDDDDVIFLDEVKPKTTDKSASNASLVRRSAGVDKVEHVSLPSEIDSDNLETNVATTEEKHRLSSNEDSGPGQAPEASSTSIFHQLLRQPNQIPITGPSVDGIPASELFDMPFVDDEVLPPKAADIPLQLSPQIPPPPMAPATIQSPSTSNHIFNLVPSHCLPHSTFDPRQPFQFEVHPGKFVIYQYLLGPNDIPIIYQPTAGQYPDKPFPLSMRNSQTGETKTLSVRPFLTEYPTRSGKFAFLLAAPAGEFVSAGNQAPPPSSSPATPVVPQMVPNQQVPVLTSNNAQHQTHSMTSHVSANLPSSNAPPQMAHTPPFCIIENNLPTPIQQKSMNQVPSNLKVSPTTSQITPQKRIREETDGESSSPSKRLNRTYSPQHSVYCAICDKRIRNTLKRGHFYLIEHIAIHMLAIHGQPRFVCRYCDHATAGRDEMRDHAISSHSQPDVYDSVLQTWRIENVKNVSERCFGLEDFVISRNSRKWSQNSLT